MIQFSRLAKGLTVLILGGVVATASTTPALAYSYTPSTTVNIQNHVYVGTQGSLSTDRPARSSAKPHKKVTHQPFNQNHTPIKVHPNNTYVALGDSVAAGLGLNQTKIGSSCLQSPNGYPQLLAASKNLQLINLSCSGATTNTVMHNQLDTAFSSGTPAVISLTVGANDMGWVQLLQKCYTSQCGTSSDTTQINADFQKLADNLRALFRGIEQRSNGVPPQVVITGYYNPVSNGCMNKQSYVDKNEIKWLNASRDALNKTIRNAMKDYRFVKYASTNFDSHGICSKQPWVQGLNESAPLHPNQLGQEAIAKSVASQITPQRR